MAIKTLLVAKIHIRHKRKTTKFNYDRNEIELMGGVQKCTFCGERIFTLLRVRAPLQEIFRPLISLNLNSMIYYDYPTLII